MILSEKDRKRIREFHTGWFQSSRFVIGERGCLHAMDRVIDKEQFARMSWVRGHCQGNVLDVGCGIGEFLASYPGPAVGIDNRLYYVALSQESNESEQHSFYCVDVNAGLPFKDQEFEVVVMAEVLEHLFFSSAIFALREALRCGNKVVLTFPNMKEDGYNLGDVESGEHCWSTCKYVIEWLVREAEGKITLSEEIINRRFLGLVVVNGKL